MPRVSSPSGVAINVVEIGSGSPVLLLPGLGATVESWGPVLDRLAERHRCIAVGNRGAGASDLAASPFGMADMADDACAVLEHLGVAAAHVVGNSLGGMVAHALALRHPGRVRSLVLAATSPGVTSIPSHPSLAYHLLAARRGDDASRCRHLAQVVHGPATMIDHPERVADVSPGCLGIPAGHGARQQLRAALHWAGIWWLRRVDAPTLVLHGSHDRLIPAANARLMARLIPGAELHLLERAGHYFISDAGDEAARVVAAFTARVDATVTLPGRTRSLFGARRSLPARAALLPQT